MVHGRGTGTYINRDGTWGNGESKCSVWRWDVGCGETKHVQKGMPGANRGTHDRQMWRRRQWEVFAQLQGMV